MSDPAFKYADTTRRAVIRIWSDGRCESHLVQAEAVQLYLAEGGVITDPDAPSLEETIKSQLATIDVKTGMVRGVRESILALGKVIDALRAGPLPDLPTAGSGIDRLRAVEDTAIALRQQLAPK